jgi:hypothetical protein
MASCPACARPVAVARPRCLYCGAALSAEAVVAAAERAETLQGGGGRAAAADRLLVVLEHRAPDAEALARALGLTLFDASQRTARGGFELLRTAPRAEAWEVAFALEAAGFLVFLVPESEARRPPTPVRGGGFEDGRLRLTTADGETSVVSDDLLLVVRGPIAREYQTAQDRIRFRSATLPAGYLVHLHLRRDVPPLELDPGNFEFAFTSRQGSLLELGLWLESLGAPTDDGFRKLAPALAPTAPEGTGVAATARALVHSEGEGALVLDNVGQFRLYSGWRGAVERRRP